MIGKTVLHYKVEARLGQGGMGEVYRAQDTRLGREVALKFLPASYHYDLDRRSRFFQEARVLSSLQSPNIAAIYDIGEFEDTSFIVMELVRGDTVASRLHRGPLSIADSVDVAMQVTEALRETHQLGIIHRDLKSSNIMMTDRGVVKLVDFGLAKVTQQRRHDDDPTVPLGQETAVGVVAGTVGYMSPEQALGRQLDARSDLFSLGVVIYEMVAGRLPFEGSSPTEIIDGILHGEIPALGRFNYQVPARLEQLVLKAMERDLDFRYQTARDMYIDLHALRRELSGIGRVVPGSQPLQEHAPTAVLSGPASEPLHNANGNNNIRNGVAVLTFTNITREPADEWIGSGIAETVTADLKNIHGISVIGRERIFEILKNRSGELAEADDNAAIEIGRRIGAAWIISGGYQRIGEVIRITARAVSVDTGVLARSVKIDGKISEIFNLQDRIVYELSQGLNLKLGHSERLEIERDETNSVEAYEDFSRGVMNLRLATRDSMDRAIYLLEKAIEHDPNYARAWGALGAAYNLKGGFLAMPELSEKAIDLLRKSIVLNPRIADAHQWLGSAYLTMRRLDEAVSAVQEAIKLEPDNAGAHAQLARIYWMGKGMVEEGIDELKQAIQLNPEAGYSYLQLSLLYIIKRDYKSAEDIAQKAVDLQEKHLSGAEGLNLVGSHGRLGYAYYMQGRYDEAITEFQKEIDFFVTSDHALKERSLIELYEKLGAAQLRKGNVDQAEAKFGVAIKLYGERLARGADDPFTRYYMACLFSLKGDAGQAVKYLEKTIAEVREINILRAASDPDFDNIRSEPAFQALMGSRRAAT
ncbi:MAG TPA: protein kinase [Blastocatellia bacterium]|nr:protein kinase [Blastocatellia bacterium]